MVTGSPSIALKIFSKSPRCIGSSLASAASRSAFVVGQDHLAHREDALRRRRTCARCGTARCPRRRTCAPPRRRPACRHWCGPSACGSNPPSPSARRNRRSAPAGAAPTRPLNTSPVAPSMVMMSPRLIVRAPAVIAPARDVDLEHAGAGDAGPPHAARHHRRVARHAAARGQDAARRMHAVNVLRARLGAHQDDVAVVGGELLGFVGRERDLAGRGARRCGQARSRSAPSARWDRASDAATGRAPTGSTRAIAVVAGRSGLRAPCRRRSSAPLPPCACRCGSGA